MSGARLPNFCSCTGLLVGTFWLWQSAGLRYLTPLQIHPAYEHLAPASRNPASFPDDWILSAPNT